MMNNSANQLTIKTTPELITSVMKTLLIVKKYLYIQHINKLKNKIKIELRNIPYTVKFQIKSFIYKNKVYKKRNLKQLDKLYYIYKCLQKINQNLITYELQAKQNNKIIKTIYITNSKIIIITY